ncbi:flagellin N-terminal helical domain-containing protein [Bacillus sp. EB01]|uniref:flagellin N-terminal helical domain-containing protein n=1 Tax=Bacillus sp. EB01 TaxID=1347086 RepID=UPI0005C50836|nr:flagellin [Bacillus sp. EB01]
MRINHNIAALNTHRQLSAANNAQQSSMEKLSSGLRINKAGDDAAGLSISEKMRGQIRGLEKASQNAQDGISMIQVAEGALAEAQDILQRMRELSVQAANDTNYTEDRTAIADELGELKTELTRIKDTTQFNNQKLLDGTSAGNAGTVTLQVGANATESMTLDFTAATGIDLAGIITTIGDIDVSDNGKAQTQITTFQTALDSVSAQRSKLGAYQNRLEHTINNLDNAAQNTTAAESRIRDVDYALAA